MHLRATAQSDSSNTHSMSDCDFWDLTISCWRHPAIAAQHPHVAACMPVMSDRRARFTMDRLQTAARQGRLAELQWLRALCQPTDPRKAMLMTAAAAFGQLQILKCLRTSPHVAPWDQGVAAKALRHPDCLQFLLSQTPPCPCPSSVVEDLAEQGQLNTLRWLHTHGELPVQVRQRYALCRAAMGGHQIVLEWLRSLDPSAHWDAFVAALAARRGDLGMLQWMRQQDPPCPWDECCTAAAAQSGHLRMLQWMRRKDPPCP